MIQKIIITDDSRAFRKALKELLNMIYSSELEGATNTIFIEQAENGLELLKKIELNKPELIFMDIEMPCMNGYDATKAVVSLYPDIKIIGMSVHDQSSYKKKLSDLGAHGYLVKTKDNYDQIKKILKGI